MKSPDTIKAMETPEEFLHPGSRALFRYWESIRGEMSAPPRDLLDLTKIRKLIPYLFMIERVAGKGFVWRLAGTHVCDLWGIELTGKPALAWGDSFEQQTVRLLFDSVIDRHQPCVLRVRLGLDSGASIAAELVAVPLRARSGQATFALGVVSSFREVARPRQDHASLVELTAARTIWIEPVPETGIAEALVENSSQPFRMINADAPRNTIN